MDKQPSVMKSILKKGIAGGIVGVSLVGAAKALGFPPVFQVMFFTYAVLGTAVFVLLDVPPVRPLSGASALVALLVFYVVISALYIGGASLLPQYDPEDEKGKIEQLLKGRREKAEQGPAHLDELIKQAQALEGKVQSLTARLARVAPSPASEPAAVAEPPKPSSGLSLVARGMEVYELHECYNCHKIGGKGSVKKRGPVLDNVGNLLTIDDLTRAQPTRL